MISIKNKLPKHPNSRYAIMANFFKVSTKKSNKIQEKKVLTVNIEKLDLNGCGVAYYKKKPVFVNGSLPQENVDAKLLEQKNKYSIAKLLIINKTSPTRVAPMCQHFMVCGGCDLQHLDYSAQLSFKQSKIIELLSRAGFNTNILDTLPWQSPILSSQWHYRHKARIGVQFDKNAQATIGFRQKSTNQLVAVKSCPVLVKPVEHIFPLLKALINQLSVKKAVGHIEVICTDAVDIKKSSQEVTLIVRQLRTLNDHDRELWQNYANKYQWHVLFHETINENSSNDSDVNTNTPLNSFYIQNNLHYCLVDKIQINFESTDFIQINQQVNYSMVEQAMAWLAPEKNDLVLDLFCGLGNFSLPLAKKVSGVIGVEGVQSMVDKAIANASFNNINNCQFFQADLNSEWLSNTWAKNKFTKVLLDPARAGAEFAVKQVIELDIETVLYVSCEPTTLARDGQILLSHGYKIEKIGLIDMFSQTKHVETMVLFTKQSIA